MEMRRRRYGRMRMPHWWLYLVRWSAPLLLLLAGSSLFSYRWGRQTRRKREDADRFVMFVLKAKPDAPPSRGKPLKAVINNPKNVPLFTTLQTLFAFMALVIALIALLLQTMSAHPCVYRARRPNEVPDGVRAEPDDMAGGHVNHHPLSHSPSLSPNGSTCASGTTARSGAL